MSNNANTKTNHDTSTGVSSAIGLAIGLAALVVAVFSFFQNEHKPGAFYSAIFFIIAIISVYFPKIYKIQLKKLGISVEQFQGLESKVDTSIAQADLLKVQIEHSKTESEKLLSLTKSAEQNIARLQQSFKSSSEKEKSLTDQIESAKEQTDHINNVLKTATNKINEINEQIINLSKIEKDFNTFVKQTLIKKKDHHNSDCSHNYPPGNYPNDPRKGQFGGKSTNKGLTLEADVRPAESVHGFFTLSLTVHPTNPSTNLEHPVCFYLHDSFRPDVMTVTPQNNRAELEILTYGAFTVGATAQLDEETIELELDLEHLRDAPELFIYS